jgi:hypothetical protein
VYSGWLGAPSFDSFRRFSNASDWNINSSLMVHSQNRIVHQSLLLSRLIFNFPADAANIKSAYGEVPFRRVLYLSQLLQALCLRQESEHYRRGRDFSPGVAGAGHCTSSGSCKVGPGGGIENWQEHAAGTMGSRFLCNLPLPVILGLRSLTDRLCSQPCIGCSTQTTHRRAGEASMSMVLAAMWTMIDLLFHQKHPNFP